MLGKIWHDGYFLLSVGGYFHNQWGQLFPLPTGGIVDILEADVAGGRSHRRSECPYLDRL